MKISFIQPSRNNLKYLKWSYDAIRKNQGKYTVEICVADDFSNDGTWEWCQEMIKKDLHFKAIRNEGPTRLGHTILYDRLINEVASHDMCMIYHADMYLCPGALDAIEKNMYSITDAGDNGERTKNKKTITSLTRIEPPLHPPGPEKILLDCGVEPEEFNEKLVLDYISNTKPLRNTTEGIFAPWAFWKEDFQEIGGHDPLYAPQSKEDSDIFNRFQLNGVKFIQTWEGFVYHMTCRGSRRNTLDKAKNIYEDSPEWLAQNQRSTRNFIRKWGHFVNHDSLMKPLIPPKYDVGIRVKGCNSELLEILEPWCSDILIDDEMQVLTSYYLDKEQKNTIINLSEKIKTTPFQNLDNEIIIEIDKTTFTKEDFGYLQNFSYIIKDSGEKGRFKLGNLDITINEMNEYQKDLIFIKK
jgi:glycosyltransferase involved in cell wall biosynthesis